MELFEVRAWRQPGEVTRSIQRLHDLEITEVTDAPAASSPLSKDSADKETLTTDETNSDSHAPVPRSPPKQDNRDTGL